MQAAAAAARLAKRGSGYFSHHSRSNSKAGSRVGSDTEQDTSPSSVLPKRLSRADNQDSLSGDGEIVVTAHHGSSSSSSSKGECKGTPASVSPVAYVADKPMPCVAPHLSISHLAPGHLPTCLCVIVSAQPQQ